MGEVLHGQMIQDNDPDVTRKHVGKHSRGPSGSVVRLWMQPQSFDPRLLA